jgi:transcription elongation factor GreA
MGTLLGSRHVLPLRGESVFGSVNESSTRSQINIWESQGMAIDRIPMSKEGYDKLKAQLDHWKNVDAPRIANQIAEARAEGDLSENAEFDSAIEAQGMLDARIRDLESKLAAAQIVDKSTIKTDRVVFGCKVLVDNLTFEEKEEYTLVSPGEDDFDSNKILASSPVGKSLIGKTVGEVAEVPIPAGIMKLKILEIGVAD